MNNVPMYVDRSWSITRKHLLAVFETFTSFKVPISPFGFFFPGPSTMSMSEANSFDHGELEAGDESHGTKFFTPEF
jgi:hypothetical protein